MKKTYAMMLASLLVLSGCQANKQETTKEEEIVEKEEEVQTEEKEEEVTVKETAKDYMKNVKAVKTHQEMESVEIDGLTKYTLQSEDVKGTYNVFKSDDQIWNIEDTTGICITEDNNGLKYDGSFIYMNASRYPTFKEFVDQYYNGSVYDYSTDVYYSEDGQTVVYGHYDEGMTGASYNVEYSYHKLTFTNELTSNNNYIILHESVTANKYTDLSNKDSVDRMVEVLGLILED